MNFISIKNHAAEQVLESLSRCAENGFFSYDLSGNITYVSSSMEEFTGLVSEQLVGKPVSELMTIPEGQNVTTCDNVEALSAYFKTAKGLKILLYIRRTDLFKPNGEKDGIMVLCLIDRYQNDIDRIQAEFISTVSHELRTPITSIKGFASTLLSHKTGIDAEKQRKYLGIIKDQAERLSRLVEDLLSVSRIESKKLQMTIHPIGIKSVAEKLAMMVEHKYNQSHQLHITVPERLPQVWVDPDRLEQILTNLFDNAVKYSPESNKVDINLSEEFVGNKKFVRVDVTDYGIGIDSGDLKKVFKKFGRLDTPLTRKTEGSGLGLFISYSLAKLMNGDLQVHREENGTRFSLFLSIDSYNPGELWLD